jgi:hypothetical protein
MNDFLVKRHYAKLVRAIDRSNRKSKDSDLGRSGVKVIKVADVNLSVLRDYFLEKRELWVKTSNGDTYLNFFEDNIISFISLLIKENNIKSDLINYIGDKVILDDAYIWNKVIDEHLTSDISGGWHDDNVGNRIKIFIGLPGLKLSEGITKTQYISGTHHFLYRPRLLGYLRYISIPLQNFLVHAFYRLRIKTIQASPNNCLIFDTNLIHRGVYKGSSNRLILVLEFIDKRKSDALALYNAPVGRSQPPRICNASLHKLDAAFQAIN